MLTINFREVFQFEQWSLVVSTFLEIFSTEQVCVCERWQTLEVKKLKEF